MENAAAMIIRMPVTFKNLCPFTIKPPRLFVIRFYSSAGRLMPHSAQNTLLPFGIPHSGHFHPPSGAGLEKIPVSVSSANAARR